MLLNPNTLSTLDQSKLYDRAKAVMKRTDSYADLVSSLDGNEIDSSEAKDVVSFANVPTLLCSNAPFVKLNDLGKYDQQVGTLNALLKQGDFHFAHKKGNSVATPTERLDFQEPEIEDSVVKYDSRAHDEVTWISTKNCGQTAGDEGSRVQEGDSTIYDYKFKGVKSHIVLDNTSGNVTFTQKREFLGGLISWNVVK